MPVRQELIDAVMNHEDAPRDPAAVSPKGAIGLMQIMPSVGKDYGIDDPEKLKDPVINKDVGTRYLSDLIERNRGDERKALIDYNQGPNRVGFAPGVEKYADDVLAEANANRPAASSAPAALNPGADDQYVAKVSQASAVFAAQRKIAQVEALAPAEKAQALANAGADPLRWALFKQAVKYPLDQDDNKALQGEQERMQKLVDLANRAGTGNAPGGIDVLHDWIGEAAANLAEKLNSPIEPQQVGRLFDLALGLGILPLGIKQGIEALRGGENPAAVLEGGEEGAAAAGEGGTVATAPETEKSAAGATAGEAPSFPEQGGGQEPGSQAPAAVPPAGEQGAGAAKPAAAGAAAEVPMGETFNPHSDLGALQMARANPMTDEEFNGIGIKAEGEHQVPAQPLSWQDKYRAVEYGGKFADDAIGAAQAFAADASVENKAALDSAMDRLDAVSEKLKAIEHEPGLSLQKLGASPGAQSLRAIWGVMDENESTPSRLAAALADMPDRAAREALIENGAKMSPGWTKMGALYKVYVNSLLSFNTVALKATSDAAMILFQVPARRLAAGITDVAHAIGSDFFDVPGTGVGISAEESNALVHGMFENLHAALLRGTEGIRQGHGMFDGDVPFMGEGAAMGNSVMAGSGFEDTWWGKGIDYYGHLVSIPGRSIIGVNEFADSMHTNMELNALAMRQGLIEAKAEGGDEASIAGRALLIASNYRKDAPGWMLDQAQNASRVNMFQQELEGGLAAMDKIRKLNYVTRSLVPFFKTMTNITLTGMRMTPLAVIPGPASGSLASKTVQTIAGGGPESALASAKLALGSAIFGYLTYHALKGNITGAVPANLKGTMRDDWLSDHQQYSIRKVGGWISAKVEPFSWIMGMAADMAPAWAYLGSGEAAHAAGVMAQATVNEFNRMPGWGAMHQIVQALDDVERGKVSGIGSIGEVATRMASSLIPSTVADLAGGLDPVRRETATRNQRGEVEMFWNELRNRIPWLKQDGLSTLDSFARPVIVPPGFMVNEFPAYISTDAKKADPVVDEQDRLSRMVGFKVPEIPRTIGPHTGDPNNLDAPDETSAYGANLSTEEQQRWLELRANPGDKMPKLYDAISAVMKSGKYLAANDTMRAAILDQVWKGYQSVAHDKLIEENPSISGRLLAAYAGKSAARVAPRSGAAANIGM